MLVAALVVAAAQPASASRYLQVGIYDEAQLRTARRRRPSRSTRSCTCRWRGSTSTGAARSASRSTRPAHPTQPGRPGVRLVALRLDRRAARSAPGSRSLFSIYGTPAWANGGKGLNVAPRERARPAEVRLRRRAPLQRHLRRRRAEAAGRPRLARLERAEQPGLPASRSTSASAGRWVIASATGLREDLQRDLQRRPRDAASPASASACGATAPRGNNDPTSSRPSVSPLAFLARGEGRRPRRRSTPGRTTRTTRIRRRRRDARTARGGAVELGNIDTLIRLVTKLYGNKRIWITEYGYETNPPDTIFGVSWAKQAAYLKQAFAIARANPRIDLMLWFLLRDDTNLNGWQSGLMTARRQEEAVVRAFSPGLRTRRRGKPASPRAAPGRARRRRRRAARPGTAEACARARRRPICSRSVGVAREPLERGGDRVDVADVASGSRRRRRRRRPGRRRRVSPRPACLRRATRSRPPGVPSFPDGRSSDVEERRSTVRRRVGTRRTGCSGRCRARAHAARRPRDRGRRRRGTARASIPVARRRREGGEHVREALDRRHASDPADHEGVLGDRRTARRSSSAVDSSPPTIRSVEVDPEPDHR